MRERIRAAILSDDRHLWLDPEDVDNMVEDIMFVLAEDMSKS